MSTVLIINFMIRGRVGWISRAMGVCFSPVSQWPDHGDAERMRWVYRWRQCAMARQMTSIIGNEDCFVPVRDVDNRGAEAHV